MAADKQVIIVGGGHDGLVVAEVSADIPTYDRSDWKHWIDADGDCQDSRQEVPIEEAVKPVCFKTASNCRVLAGEWLGIYTNTIVTDPSKLDVDHMAPLRNAHDSGAWARDAAQKENYANDLTDPDHLIAVTASANRSKRARDPEGWKPTATGYWREYAQDWVRIKITWSLTITAAERDALV